MYRLFGLVVSMEQLPFTQIHIQHWLGHDLRIVTSSQHRPLVVAKDVASCLGYRDAESVTRHLDPSEKGYVSLSTEGGVQRVLAMTEAGLHRATLRSRKGKANDFRLWVTETVLPSVMRSLGGPRHVPDALAEPFQKLVGAIRTQVQQEHQARMLELEGNVISSLTNFHELAALGRAFLRSTSLFTYEEVCWMLNVDSLWFRDTLITDGVFSATFKPRRSWLAAGHVHSAEGRLYFSATGVAELLKALRPYQQ